MACELAHLRGRLRRWQLEPAENRLSSIRSSNFPFAQILIFMGNLGGAQSAAIAQVVTGADRYRAFCRKNHGIRDREHSAAKVTLPLRQRARTRRSQSRRSKLLTAFFPFLKPPKRAPARKARTQPVSRVRQV